MNIDIRRAVKAGFALAVLFICTGCGSEGGSCMATGSHVKYVVKTEYVPTDDMSGPFDGLSFYGAPAETSTSNSWAGAVYMRLMRDGAYWADVDEIPDITSSLLEKDGEKLLLISFRDREWTLEVSEPNWRDRLEVIVLEMSIVVLEEQKAAIEKKIRQDKELRGSAKAEPTFLDNLVAQNFRH